MATRPDPTAKKFARFVKDAAAKAGYAVNSSSGDGKAKLAERTGMSEADIAKILNGEFDIPSDPLKPLADALDVEQKELLRAAGVLDDKPARAGSRPLTVQLAAQRLGIKSQKNVAAFETLVTALLDAEKRR
ncbi:helix-turn-helix transcriptional regulator [Streptomyces sp. NPDC047042]|uniref:helix-turn-helix transcriptional regulator n=1 Tax=Streptomyces sp. NPDC047042 TaxID=3154807 RepID=UPI0033F484C2